MPRPNKFPALVFGSIFIAGLTCGTASAQDGKSVQDGTPPVGETSSGMATGKRMHKPVSITMEVGKQGQHHTMADMDTDKDGRLSRSEFAAAHGGKMDEFAAHDLDGDGFITQAEMDQHHADMQAADGLQQHKDNPTMTEGEHR